MRNDDGELIPEIVEFLIAKRAAEQAQDRLKRAQEVLCKTMEAEQAKSWKWTDDDQSYSVTYVQSRTPVIDEKGLRKELTAKVFDRYTVRTLDKRAMERAMAAGEIDPVVVAKHVTERLSTPYPKLSVTQERKTG